MNQTRWRFLVGGALVVAGALALFGNVFSINMAGFIWGIIFGVAGLTFLGVTAMDRKAWWGVIPGFTLLGIGGVILLDELSPRLANMIGGAFVVGGIALAFLTVYFLNRKFWWALIPAGTMISITLLIILENFMDEPAWIFLLGLAATFGLLTLIRVEGQKMTWPIYPAVALLVVTGIVMFASVDWAGYVWPVILIAGGGVMVWRALASRN